METRALPSAILETCLHVADLAQSRAFYTGLFAYSVLKGDDRFCAMATPAGQILILFQRGSDPLGTELPFGYIPPHGSTGEAHIGFSVPASSLEAWRARLAAQGIEVESSFTWPAGGTSIYFRDPDKNLLELLSPGVWPNY